MKYQYVIRTYDKDGRNIYAEGAYTLDDADKRFKDVCKTVDEVTNIYKRDNKHHYVRVVMLSFDDNTFSFNKIVSEKIYEC
jgi:hypothetical protein